MKPFLRLTSLCLAFLFLGIAARAQLTGSRTVPSTNYPTLAVAIDSLNLYGVGSGGVTISVTAGQTAPTGGYRLGSATLNASTSSTNRLIINGNSSNVTAFTGTGNTDGMFYIMGTDYVTINALNLLESSSNTSAASQMEWGYNLVKLTNSAPYDGCQNVLINGCTIQLNRTNTRTVGIRAAHTLAGSTTNLSTSSATDASTNSYNEFTANTITQVVRGFSLVGINSGETVYDKNNKIGGSTKALGNTIVLGTGNGSTTLYGTYTQNDSVITIRNNSISSSTNVSGSRYLIYMSTGVGDLTVTGNNLDISANTNGSNSIYAYYNYGISGGHGDLTSDPEEMLSTHTITGNTITGSSATTNVDYIYGIFEYYTYCRVMNISNNILQNITWNAEEFYGIYTGGSGCPYITIEDNKILKIDNRYNYGYMMLFYQDHYNSSFGVFSMKRNVIRNVKALYLLYPYYVMASYTAPPSGYAGQKYICHNNVADSLDLSASTGAYIYNYPAYYGWDSSEVKYNSMTNIKGSSTGTTYVDFMAYGYYGPNSYKVVGNTISNISGFNLYNNFYIGYYATHCDSNTISNITATGNQGYVFNYLGYQGSNVSVAANKMVNWNLSGSGYIYNYLGYFCGGANIHHNRIDSLTWGTNTSYPFYTYANNADHNVYNNIVSNLKWASTSINVYPYYLQSTGTGTNVSFYNNFLSNVNPPAAYNNTNSAGVYLNSNANYNVYNNTIYINPGITGGTNYGFSGIYYTSSGMLDLRNNIINVNVTPTGTGYATALRRNSGTAGTPPANFLGTSNGNIYYAPNVSNSWLYGEGTSAAGMVNKYDLTIDPNFNTPCGRFKTFMGHNQASFTENKLSAAALPFTYAPTGSTYAEKGGVPTSSPAVLTDYANVTRGPVSDIGALEFSGTVIDNAPPIISYTPIPVKSYCASAPTLLVTITDNSGVASVSGATAPRLYYKKSTENNSISTAANGNTSSYNGWKYVEATSVSGSVYTFNFDYTILASTVSAGDQISYFVIAEDNASPVNAGASVAAFAVCPTTVALTSSNAPIKSSPAVNQFTILANPGFTVTSFPNSSCGPGSSSITIVPTPLGTGIQWQKATLTGTFANISGATSPTYNTGIDTATTRYRALLLCGSATLATTKIDTFIIAKPAIISAKGDTLCGYGQHTLTANPTPFTTPYWYTSATGGTALSTGDTFKTPFINATQTYYVGANTPNASTEILACPEPQMLYSYAAFDGYGMELTFRNPSTHFYQTTVYPYSANGTFDIELLDEFGNPVSASKGGPYILPGVSVVGGNGTTPVVINLPFRNIPPGKYQLVTTNVKNSPYLNFQYLYSTSLPVSTPSGNVTANSTLIGSSVNYYWMYFYNNVFGADCEAPGRIPVVAHVTAAPAITVSAPGLPGICLGTCTSLSATSANPYYNYVWTPGPLSGGSQSVCPTSTTVYHVIASDPYTGCVNHDSVVMYVNPVPVPPTIAPTNPTICQNGSVQLVATAPLGASYTAQVGTSKTTYGDGYNLWFPFGGYYMGQHTQYLIRASELTAAGIRKGALTSVAFYQVTPPSSTIATYLMRLAPTTTNTLSSFISTGFTTVANLTSLTVSGTGWKTITFSTPFPWDGTSNIVLDIAQNNCTSCPTSMCSPVYGQSGDVEYTSTSWNSVLYGYSWGGCDVASFAPTQNWSGPWTYNLRPNMLFNWRAPADVNWLNVTGLYKNTGLSTAVSLTDTNSVVYSSPTATTVYTAITNFQGCKSGPSIPDTVNVIPAPVVTVTPAGPQTICAGQPVTLCIPTGANQTYQWYLNNVAIAGAVSNCYVAGAAGTYKVTATNIITGCSATSIPTVLTVNTVPTVNISASGPTTICNGSNVVLTANSSTAVAWQWELNGTPIAGATSSSYTASASGTYTVTVTNLVSCTKTANPVTITVNTIPSTVTPNGSTTFCSGGSVVLNAASGVRYGYQWYAGTSALTGETSSAYTATAAGSYYVVIFDSTTGCTTTSTPIPVAVGAGPNAAITPQGTVGGCMGGTVTLHAVKQPGLCYQWYQGTKMIGGAIDDSLVVSANGSYTVEVSICSTACISTTTVPAVINLNPLPSAAVTPSSVSAFCQGDSAVLNANAGAGLSYQWEFNNTAIPGATSARYAARTAGKYQVRVTDNSTGCSDTSTGIAVAVNTPPSAIITPSGSTTFCLGDNVVLVCPPSPGNPVSYQWYLNNTPITGSAGTASSYTATATGLYTVKVTGSNGCSATSIATPIQVNALPNVTTVPTGSTAVCQGYTTILSAASGPSQTYQWYIGTNPIAGATSNTYTTGTAGTYSVKITNTATGCFATSAGIAVSVNTPPTATATMTGSGTICEGDSVKLDANTSTGSGLTYQWKFNGSDIASTAGGTSAVYYAKASGRYTVAVSSAANCTTLSNSIAITVNPRPAAYITYNTPLEFCEGSAVVLTANAGTGLSYQWYMDGVSLSNTSNINIAALSGKYTLRVTNTFNCVNTADTLDVTVYPTPVPTIVRTNSTLSTSQPYVSYQWYYNNDPIGTGTSSTYTFTENGAYKVRVVDDKGCEGNSGQFFVSNVGVAQTAAARSIKVYPNPTTGKVFIESKVKVKLVVRDVTGKSVLEAKEVTEIDLGDVATGLYQLYITDLEGKLLRVEKLTKTDH